MLALVGIILRHFWPSISKNFHLLKGYFSNNTRKNFDSVDFKVKKANLFAGKIKNINGIFFIEQSLSFMNLKKLWVKSVVASPVYFQQ